MHQAYYIIKEKKNICSNLLTNKFVASLLNILFTLLKYIFKKLNLI